MVVVRRPDVAPEDEASEGAPSLFAAVRDIASSVAAALPAEGRARRVLPPSGAPDAEEEIRAAPLRACVFRHVEPLGSSGSRGSIGWRPTDYAVRCLYPSGAAGPLPLGDLVSARGTCGACHLATVWELDGR